VTRFCERGNETSGSVSGVVFPEYPIDCGILKKDFDPWGWCLFMALLRNYRRYRDSKVERKRRKNNRKFLLKLSSLSTTWKYLYVWLTIDLHVVPRLIIRGALPPAAIRLHGVVPIN
jgi:hypothetical protein